MIDSRRKQGVLSWTIAIMIAMLVAYPLSFGPACWVCSRVPEGTLVWETTDFFYAPILWGWYDAPPLVSRLIGNYANLGAKGDLTVAKILDGSFCVIHAG